MKKISQQPGIDPGFGVRTDVREKRLINHDGSYNIIRKNARFHPRDIYHYLINVGWTKFFLLVLAEYLCANMFFGTVYSLIGADHLVGADTSTPLRSFLSCFFFSVQTFTTVGYGGMYPKGILISFVAGLEAMFGLLAFALATGLLYGRFSKPTSRILFSRNAIIAPYRGGESLQFRLANQRSNKLLEMQVTVSASIIDRSAADPLRQYFSLELERSSVYFFPSSWTIVHPLNENSPLAGKNPDELRELETEILIVVKGFDDTFSQTVHAMYSYRAEEIIFGAKFRRAFYTDNEGNIILDLNMVHEYEKVVPAAVSESAGEFVN